MSNPLNTVRLNSLITDAIQIMQQNICRLPVIDNKRKKVDDLVSIKALCEKKSLRVSYINNQIPKKGKEVKKDNCINIREDDQQRNQPNSLLNPQDS